MFLTTDNENALRFHPVEQAANPIHSFQKQIAHIDALTLAGIVSRAYNQILAVNHWQVAPLGAVDLSTQITSGGVYRVWGAAVDEMGVPHDWSLVVKILKSPAGLVMPNGLQISRQMAEEQSNFSYWKREALALQSGLLDNLPAGLTTPHYVELIDRGDAIWLWQTEVSDDREWSWADYREAAYRLGLWQGQTVVSSRPLPSYPWLSHHWLRKWVELPLSSIAQLVEQMDGWQLPLVQVYFTPEEVSQLRRLWAGREQRMAALAALPHSLSHLDAYRSNLFWQGDELTLIDWAFVGLAAMGEELAAFVGATLLLDHLPTSEAARLEGVALDGYLAGLKDAGWGGDPVGVLSAYRHAMPLRYGLISFASMLRTVFDPGFGAAWQKKEGRPLPEILQHRAEFIRFLLAVDSA
jgi:hypothetical protein